MEKKIKIGLIVIFGVALLGGWFALDECQKCRLTHFFGIGACDRICLPMPVKVTDSLLTKNKEICSPYDDDGTPYCYSPEILNNFSLVWQNPKCPGTDEIPEKIEIYNTMTNTKPAGGKARIAYYCASTNQFWVFEYDSEKVPMPYWFGSYRGYPIK